MTQNHHDPLDDISRHVQTLEVRLKARRQIIIFCLAVVAILLTFNVLQYTRAGQIQQTLALTQQIARRGECETQILANYDLVSGAYGQDVTALLSGTPGALNALDAISPQLETVREQLMHITTLCASVVDVPPPAGVSAPTTTTTAPPASAPASTGHTSTSPPRVTTPARVPAAQTSPVITTTTTKPCLANLRECIRRLLP